MGVLVHAPADVLASIYIGVMPPNKQKLMKKPLYIKFECVLPARFAALTTRHHDKTPRRRKFRVRFGISGGSPTRGSPTPSFYFVLGAAVKFPEEEQMHR